MAKLDPEIVAHLEWIGFVKPTGLVVSAQALVRAGAILDRRDIEGQRLLRDWLERRTSLAERQSILPRPDFQDFAEAILRWSFSAEAYAGTREYAIPPDLEVALTDYGDVLRPDFAVRELETNDGGSSWQLLVSVLEPGQDFDQVVRGHGRFEASPQGRMERLLRQTGVPAGLLFNAEVLRLVSAPRGESSGWMDFRVADMVQTAGRPIATALRLLLSQSRLLALSRDKRLAALLDESRKFQNEVSERLAEQVLHALYELLRGLQAAHDASRGELLREALAEHPDEVYRALLTMILRLVFVLYAEQREMLPKDDRFLQHYSLAGLYDRLRDDAALYPDTMGQRFGAWAQMLVLFRLIYDGAHCGSMHLPERHGALFDPDRFPFLEGRTAGSIRQAHERIEPPLVPDGTIYRALDKLLLLDGERISYRALDVEQIGSVYETMMGFRLETATGRSVAVKAQKRSGAPTAVDLDALLRESGTKRAKWIRERADRQLSEGLEKSVAQAASVEDLHAALVPVIDAAATPDMVSAGAMVLQPSEERRRSGSHYTPRSLTEPIVRTTLAPILARLRGPEGRPPRPQQVLDLKVCDPAMGSGAFLVEACRELGDALVEAWHAHGEVPRIPPDEDEATCARRLVAQRCLYGVDRNPIAADLAKVSLWLATLARDHPLTFLDHALRHGDSLVGLSRKEIEAFHWDPGAPRLQAGFETMRVRDHIAKVAELRQRIREAEDSTSDWELRDLWDEAQSEIEQVRLFGDLAVAAFFEGAKPKDCETKRGEYAAAITAHDANRFRPWLEELRHADPPRVPFHWEIEFPEVFERPNSGFDAIVGNPPFAGKNSIAAANVPRYGDWLQTIHEESHGNADLVAHFYRRAFDLLRNGAVLGLIATNTIAQGDTRSTGLRWICKHGGEIFDARKRVKWPGQAAVIVSVLHIMKGPYAGSRRLDGRPVDTITAFLFHHGGSQDPVRLAANAGRSFIGSYVLGMGFTFDDTDRKGVATPLAEMRRLIEKQPCNKEVIFPYIGGEELNTSPTQAYHRFVINLGEHDEPECRRRWPDLMAIVETKVKPERLAQNDRAAKETWWQFIRTRPELHRAIAGLDRVLVISRISNAFALTFLPVGVIYNEKIVVFPFSRFAPFTVLQCRLHETWARFLSSTLKDDLQYTPSDCFETFPFPKDWESKSELDAAGGTYFECRARIMVRNGYGLTKTYNRFHDPEERDAEILELRGLHAVMDRVVLDAYGWSDIPVRCEFLLDYAIDEEEWSDRKRPWRYRWPDDVRDEILGRLLELNAKRSREEARSGTVAERRRRGKAARNRTASMPDGEDLFS